MVVEYVQRQSPTPHRDALMEWKTLEAGLKRGADAGRSFPDGTQVLADDALAEARRRLDDVSVAGADEKVPT
jgi:hypothetical protein